MRKIKFRAWYKKDKEMRLPLGVWDIHLLAGRLEDYILMQYTGLKEKNGKEIYEGDIIEHISSSIYGEAKIKEEVRWNDGLAGFNPFCDYDSDCSIYVEMGTVEIIGNIHENKDLLK